jgi:hypothetical protein
MEARSPVAKWLMAIPLKFLKALSVVTWISDPMPLTLEFNGTVDGDEVTGSVTLGNFGSSSFSGTRS